MKKVILFTALLIFCDHLLSQNITSEKIDWNNLKAFSAASFTFKTAEVEYDCKNCRYLEIRTISGATGYFLLGTASYMIKKDNMEGMSSGIMIRINPKDSASFLRIEKATELKDKGFKALSLLMLQSIFKRCYHAGMDALIPLQGEYTINLFSDVEGDILVSYGDKKISIFRISK